MDFICESVIEELFCYSFDAQPENFAFVKDNIFSAFDTEKANIIVHQVNCMGIMGAGIAKQIKKRYPPVYEYYHKLCTTHSVDYLLGKAQGHTVSKNQEFFKMIVNLFGQEAPGWSSRQTNYEAFYKGLVDLKNQLEEIEKDFPPNNRKLSVAFPYKIGCGLAGGEWNIIYNMIYNVFGDDTPDARHVFFYIRPEDYDKELGIKT